MGRIEHKYYAFEWDDAKNLSNQKKHGLSFETAVNAFFDEHCLTAMDVVQDGEQRWKTLGQVDGAMVLFIGHVIFDENEEREVIRLITARQATKDEQRGYYANY